MFFATNLALVESSGLFVRRCRRRLPIPANRTRQLLTTYDPDYLRYTYNDVLDCLHPVSELEALMRQCMILHNQYPWDPSTSAQSEIGNLKDDDYVVAFHPRNQEVLRFIQRVKQGHRLGSASSPGAQTARHAGLE
jgi:3-oxoacyl-[acyl-carrier-protein] synthase III